MGRSSVHVRRVRNGNWLWLCWLNLMPVSWPVGFRFRVFKFSGYLRPLQKTLQSRCLGGLGEQGQYGSKPCESGKLERNLITCNAAISACCLAPSDVFAVGWEGSWRISCFPGLCFKSFCLEYVSFQMV